MQPLPSGEAKLLVRDAYNGSFVQAGGEEFVVFVRDGVLYGSAFDSAKLELTGASVPLIDDLAGDPTRGAGHFDISRSGTLLYRAGRESQQKWPALWMDKAGQTKPLISDSALYITPRFSPDGKKLAISSRGAGGLAIYDLEKGTVNRFPYAGYPAWTQDGKYLAVRDATPPGIAISWIRADGGGERQVLYKIGRNTSVYGFTADAKTLLIVEQSPQGDNDIVALPLDTTDPEHPKPGKPIPLAQTPASESFPALSPNGKWLAYMSNQTGRGEVYVKPFPTGTARWQITTEGGGTPLWAPDGRSLFFVNDSHIYVVDITAKADAIAANRPRLWSPTPIRLSGDNLSYAIHPDGQRFVVYPMPEPSPEEKGNAHMTFVLNFADDLRRRVDAAK